MTDTEPDDNTKTPADAPTESAPAAARESAAPDTAAAPSVAREADEPETTSTMSAAREPADSTTTSASAESGKRRFALPTPGRKGRAALAAAAAALLVGSLTASVALLVQHNSDSALLAAHEQAREAACRYAPTLADYDAKSLDTYFAAVAEGATGDWRTQFESTSAELREVLVAGEVVSRVEDVQCGLRNGDESSAEVVVVIGQTITSLGTQSKPQPGQLAMVMRLEKSGDQWLVNRVDSPLAAMAPQ